MRLQAQRPRRLTAYAAAVVWLIGLVGCAPVSSPPPPIYAGSTTGPGVEVPVPEDTPSAIETLEQQAPAAEPAEVGPSDDSSARSPSPLVEAQPVSLAAQEAGAADTLPPPGPESWPSFRHDDRLTGVSSSDLPAELELLWTHEAGDFVSSTAAIVGPYVYVGCLSGELLCLDRETGEKVWGYFSAERKEKNTFLPGFKSSPTVTADRVYLGDEDGRFHAVDRATGKAKWTFATGGEIISSATIVGDRVIFGSYDNSLYCLNADGTLAWRYMTEGYVNCTPAVSEGYTFIAGCDEHLRVIDVQTGEQQADIPLQTYLIASPAVMGEMLYVGTYASEVVGVNWKQKQIVWRYRDESREFPYHASAAITDRYVVVGGRDKLVHCIERQSGEGVWTFPTRGRVDSSPVIVGERVFVGSSDGNLYELALSDGRQRWKHNVGKPITASPAVGAGCLVVGSETREGKILCFGRK